MDAATCAAHAAATLATLPYVWRHFRVSVQPSPEGSSAGSAPPPPPPPGAQPLPELLVLCRASSDTSTCASAVQVDGLGTSATQRAAGYFTTAVAPPALSPQGEGRAPACATRGTASDPAGIGGPSAGSHSASIGLGSDGSGSGSGSGSSSGNGSGNSGSGCSGGSSGSSSSRSALPNLPLQAATAQPLPLPPQPPPLPPPPLPARPPLGVIHLLADRLADPHQVAAILRHELTHAMDHSVHGLDMGTCAGLACSEVRAAGAGECAGVWPGWARRACSARVARASVGMVFGAAGGGCVEAMLGACWEGGVEASPVRAVEAALARERAGGARGQG